MSSDALGRLRTLVHADPALALELRRLEPGALKPALLTIAEEHGIDLDANDLERAIANAKREWTMRWMR
jgi:hypothetical protein